MTAAEYQRVSISRVEERHPQGWLGVIQRDPGALPNEGWWPDEPEPGEPLELAA